MKFRLALNSRSSYFSLLNARIAGACHYTWLICNIHIHTHTQQVSLWSFASNLLCRPGWFHLTEIYLILRVLGLKVYATLLLLPWKFYKLSKPNHNLCIAYVWGGSGAWLLDTKEFYKKYAFLFPKMCLTVLCIEPRALLCQASNLPLSYKWSQLE